MPEDEWKNNLRMSKEDYFCLVHLLAPHLNPDPNAVRTDCLSAEKKVAMCLYY